MKKKFIPWLICPWCGGDFCVEIIDEYVDEILEGFLFCKCSKRYPIRKGVAIIIDNDCSYNQSMKVSQRFGWQWKRFSSLSYFYTDQFLKWITPLNQNNFRGKKVLDAGCGKGRHLVIAANWGAKFVFGVDLSFESAVVAFRNTMRLENVCVLCADLFKLPFRDDFFDLIYSVGVIHHTPDPGMCFKALSSHLRKNGDIVVWVYAKETNRWLINCVNPIRKMLTSRIPLSLTLIISFFISLFLYAVLKCVYIPFNRFSILKPFSKFLFYNKYLSYISFFPFNEIWCIVFDHLMPQIASYHTKEEIKVWFEKAGIEIKAVNLVNGSGWSFWGRKA